MRGGREVIIHAYCHVRNDVTMLRWWLRHYAAFCSELHIFDDASTDGTRELAQAHPKATLHDIPFTGLDENALLDLAHMTIPASKDRADYVIWADVDEFIYHPKILECLARFKASGFNVVRTLGFNMMGSPLPADDGHSQLIDLYRTGVRAPVYSKPIIVDPGVPVRWSCAKHALANEAQLRLPPEYKHYEPEYWRMRLLHFRYLTPEYCRHRNARQYDRSTVKTTAWSCAPDYIGEHSDVWVEATMKKAHDVVCEGAHWHPPGEMDA
jgi:hypothetical protein